MKKIILLFLLLFCSNASAQIWFNDTLEYGFWHGGKIDTSYLRMDEISSGSGTVTSVALSGTNGLSVLSGSPITTAGTIALGITNLSLADTSLASNSVTTSKILNSNVTLAKLANIADQTILGNNSGGSAAPIALTASQAKSVLSIANTDVSGLGTASTHAATDFFLVSNNLSEGTASTIKTNLSLNNVENIALSTWAGTSNVITLGTITTGVWHGTAIANANLANSSMTIAGHSVSLGGTQTISASDVGLGSVTNDAQTKASIVPNTAPSAGQILVGNAGGTAYAPQTLSGSGSTATLSSAGVLTLSSIANASLANGAVANLSGTNTGDQTITLGTDLSGSGSSTVNATIVSNAVTTTKINNAAVTLAKIANAATNSVLVGSGSSGSGSAYTEITLSGGLSMSSGVLSSSQQATSLTSAAFASPSATIGLTANNGTATTAMRSDATPVLGVAIIPVWTGLHSFNKAGIASTHTDAILLENTTAATGGATLQRSPSIDWLAHYWGTTATAADSTATFHEELIPTSGAGRAPFRLTWSAGNAATDMNTVMTLSNTGVLTATTFSGALSGNATTATSAATWTTARNLAGNSVDGSGNVAFSNAFIVQGTTDAGLSGAQFLGALGTGIVKNTTTTGVLSIAVAGDFPTLDQNTTGTANIAGGTLGAICYQSAANTSTILAATATARQLLLSGASAAPTWSTNTFPNTANAGDILTATASNTIGVVAATATANKHLVSQANATSVWSTPTFPNTSGTVGQYMMSDGTNAVWSNNQNVSSTSATGALNTTQSLVIRTPALAASRLQAGTCIRIILIGTCTSTAANTSTFVVKLGQNGTTGDAFIDSAITSVAATSGSSVPFKVEFNITIRTTGSSATNFGFCTVSNTGITGISANQSQVILPLFQTFNTTTANNILSVFYKSAASTTTSTFQIAEILFDYQ